MVTLADDNAVLAAPGALTPPAEETTVVDRSSVLAAYRSAATELGDGDVSHLFVWGPPGSGKSLLTRRVLAEQLDAEPTVVACGDYGSNYGVAVALANALDPTGEQFSQSGHAEEAVLATLADRLGSASGVVVLDGVETIETEAFLSTVVDATADGGVRFVCVADDRSVRNELPVALRRRLCERELYVDAYDRPTIRQILAARVDAAFREGTVSPEVLDRCSALVSTSFGGDLGRGIRLLAFVAVVADEDDATRVSLDHVDHAHDRLVSRRLQAHLADASPHRARLLRALLECPSGDDAPRIGTLYETYREHCEEAGVDPISERGIHDHLRSLRETEFVTVTSHRTGEPGHYYRYHLAVQPAAVRLALAAVGE